MSFSFFNLKNNNNNLNLNKYKMINGNGKQDINNLESLYEDIDYNVKEPYILTKDNNKNISDSKKEISSKNFDINNKSLQNKDQNLNKGTQSIFYNLFLNPERYHDTNSIVGTSILNMLFSYNWAKYNKNDMDLYLAQSLNNDQEHKRQTVEIKEPYPTLSFSESYTDGTAISDAFQVYTEEPDPAIAINYWDDRLNTLDFVYPKDEKTNKSLGAWPKNYKDYPAQLSNYKIYQDNFIWPTTPENGKYQTVYRHNGFDILADFGTPIYSPVDGVIEFSSWGDTPNTGTDENAYTITIRLTEPITVNGIETEKIDSVFLGHLSGIRYRVDYGSEPITVKKGELLGFVGNASGLAEEPGWAPHLHMSYFDNTKGYDTAFLWTEEMERIYNIKSNDNIKYGK